MPRGYEQIRDALHDKGMSMSAAKGKAARIWNSMHPENPVGRHHRETSHAVKNVPKPKFH